MVCVVVGSASRSTAFLRVFMASSQAVRGVGAGFEEPHLRLIMV